MSRALEYGPARLCFVLFLFLTSLFSAETLRQTVRFAPENLTFRYFDGQVVVELTDCEAATVAGRPALPVAIRRVLIPAGMRATGVRVVRAEYSRVPGEYRVYPVQPARAVSSRAPVGFVLGDAPGPQAPVELAGTGEKAGFRIADLLINPVTYAAETGQLSLLSELVFELDCAFATDVPRLTSGQRALAVADVARLVVNPEDIDRFAPQTRATGFQDWDCIVISAESLRVGFGPLLAWYRETGLRSDFRSREWIDGNYPGVDGPERIRNFIIDYQANHGLSYVLLAGDTQLVPCRRARSQAAQYVDDLPCDLYYADLQWSWDGDHDGIWGEFDEDTVDYYADVVVGRAPVDDSMTVATFVAKTLKYALTPDTGYQARLLLPYTQLYSFYPSRQAQDSIAGYAPRDWLAAIFTGMTNQWPLHDSIESGYGLVHVVAHGNDTGLYTMNGAAIYRRSTAALQTNRGRLPVFNSIACYSGNFEKECVAEALMNNPNGGAVGVIMNSRYGIAQPPGLGPAERLDLRFYDFLFCGDSVGLGRVHTAAKDYHAALARAGGIWQWSLYELNLFGDPGLPVWTAAPQVLSIDCPRILNPGLQSVRATVLRRGRPIAGARVRLLKDGDFDANGITGPDGRVTLDFTAATPGGFVITARARNGIPRRDSGLVRDSGAYVHLLRHELADTAPGGNGDSIANPGEVIRLPAWFRNVGNRPAADVTIRLRTGDTLLAVRDSLARLGALAPGESAWATALGIRVDPDCESGRLPELEFTALDRGETIGMSRVPVLIARSRLEFAGCEVVDTLPGGNGNGRLDPGESAELVVALANTGLGHAYDVRARLRSTSQDLEPLDSLGAFGVIRYDSAGRSALDRYVVRADAAIPRESSVDCSLIVSRRGEPGLRLAFVLPVGRIMECDPVPDTGGTARRYYAYDDTDTGYAACPAFDWVEARGRGVELALGNDSTVRFMLPFPVRYFGSNVTSISICSNGWLSLGHTTARSWTNRRLPDGQQPNSMLCPNWDNFDPTRGGTLWYWYDTLGRRVIVEWDSVAYRDTSGARDKFQAIIYDTSVARTPTGDNEFVFQYLTANYYGSSSIGIENDNSTIGVNYLYDSAYHRAAATIVPGRVIRFTTVPPNAGLAERAGSPAIESGLAVWPSVGRREFTIHYALGPEATGELVITDPTGRRIARQLLAPARAGVTHWRPVSPTGHPLPLGVYFCELRSATRSLVRKLLVVR